MTTPDRQCDQSKKPTTFDNDKVKYDKTNPFVSGRQSRLPQRPSPHPSTPTGLRTLRDYVRSRGQARDYSQDDDYLKMDSPPGCAGKTRGSLE